MMFKSCLVAALLCVASALIENIDHPGRIPGEYLITLREAPSDVQALRESYVQSAADKIRSLAQGIQILNHFNALKTPILHLKADEVTISQAMSIPEVINIEADVYEQRIEQCGSQATGNTYWGLSRTSSRDAPNYGSASYSYSTTGGSGVRVYVLDTGIRTTHEDFSGGRAVFGFNAVGGNNDDRNGHGTHCAGTVLGRNSGVSKAAVAVAVKVLGDSGSGSTSGIVNGINFVISDLRNHGRGVISMSLGGGRSTAMDNAVASAVSANIPTVVSAGNSNGNACNQSPARASDAITVGSTDSSDRLSSFSNWGNCVNILAPGSSIRSASSSSNTGYRNLSGTSMACPHVAGAAATYLASNPSASASAVRSYLVNQATKNVINMRGTSGTPNALLYSSC